jgi:hypothetical protein
MAPVAVLSLIGCTSILGIDGDYSMAQKERDSGLSGSTGAGGDGATTAVSGGGGLVTATGGASPGGAGSGATSGGGSGATLGCPLNGSTCPMGEKCCAALNGVDTFCTKPDPSVGCSLDACGRCPQPPPNATAVCNANHQCDIQCNAGSTRSGTQCISHDAGAGAGGQGGAQGGSGGGPAVCDPLKCPSSLGAPGTPKGCTIASPFGCCKNNGTCGCTWATSGTNAAYCL